MRAHEIGRAFAAVLIGASLYACSDAGRVPFVAGDVGGTGGSGGTGTQLPGSGGTSASRVCGNGSCESGETCSSCPDDCACENPYCGDGRCDGAYGESCSSCASDCACTSYCGNGSCESANGESCSSCAQDCPCGGYCGDGACVNADGESYRTCATDCAFGCASDWTYNVPQCDTCMRQNCCAWVQACDTGTSCRLVDTCRFQNCVDAADFMSCMSTYCNSWGVNAFDTWQSYYNCLNGPCPSACAN